MHYATHVWVVARVAGNILKWTDRSTAGKSYISRVPVWPGNESKDGRFQAKYNVAHCSRMLFLHQIRLEHSSVNNVVAIISFGGHTAALFLL